MLRYCCFCSPEGRFFGEKEPYENKERTDGLCPECDSLVQAGFEFKKPGKYCWATWVREER